MVLTDLMMALEPSILEKMKLVMI